MVSGAETINEYVEGLACIHCGREFASDQMFEGCPTCRREDFAANLQVRYDRRRQARAITRRSLARTRSVGLRRYLPLLPVDAAHPFETWGVGATPLVRSKALARLLGLDELYLKDESLNRTGSVKDRRAGLGVNIAAHFGARGLVTAGGNTGAAAAAASARYSLPVVNAETTFESPTALLQSRAYGALSVILGSYEARCALMKQCVDELGFHPLSSYTAYPTGDPYSQEGDKTIAYEVCEDLGWKAPDKVLVPAGQGLILSGIWSGFVDLFELGLIESLPIMIGVESFAGRAFSGTRVGGPRLDEMRPEGATIARHACASRAALKGLKAIADSKGYSVAVAEEDILRGAISLAREDGILPSTTSSTTIAAVGQLVHSGLLETTDAVVCVITASGLKDVDLLERGVEPTPSIAPDLASLRRLAETRGIRLSSPV